MRASKSLFFHSIDSEMVVSFGIIPFTMSINCALSRIRVILSFHILSFLSLSFSMEYFRVIDIVLFVGLVLDSIFVDLPDRSS